MALKSRADTRRMLVLLEEAYPDAKCELNYQNPFELLLATMMSAQCTDVRVNMVTERLFKKYPRPEDYVGLSTEILEEEIREVGLFRMKSQNIISTCKMLLKFYGGEVPKTQEELIQFPGVGRKTANVVVSNAFGVPALAVDTHVKRISNRIGISNSMHPDSIERQLCLRIPQKLWTQAHHWLIFHGRQVCTARNPKCGQCVVSSHCKFYAVLQDETQAKLRERVFPEPAPVQKKASQRKLRFDPNKFYSD